MTPEVYATLIPFSILSAYMYRMERVVHRVANVPLSVLKIELEPPAFDSHTMVSCASCCTCNTRLTFIPS